jgi:hypothetical protein
VIEHTVKNSHRRHISTVDLEIIFHTVFVGMCVIHFHTKFNLPSCSGSSFIASNRKLNRPVYFIQPPFCFYVVLQQTLHVFHFTF